MEIESKVKNDRQQIKEVFGDFIASLESNNLKEARHLMVPEAKAHFSTVGAFDGVNAIIDGLTWKGAEINVSRYKITNFVAFSAGDIAQQSAYINVLLGLDDGKQLYPFEFGGHFANSYVRTPDGWKLASIKFDLDWEKGNTILAKSWTLMNYNVYGGHPLAILSEFDAPWRVIPNPDDRGTDEEQIEEAYYRYAWGLDQGDIELVMTSYTDDIVSIMPPPHATYKGKRELTHFMKSLRHKEAALSHSVKIVDIKVEGDHATMIAYRIEPHRLGWDMLHRGNMNYSFYSAKYFNELRKENGIWKLSKIDYHMGGFYEIEANKNRYV